MKDERKGLRSKLKVRVLMLFALSAWVAVSANAWAAYEDGILPEFKLSASGSLDVYSRYVWRGFTLDTDPVVQPGFAVSGYGVTVSYWGNADADNNDSLSSGETDFVVDYTRFFDYTTISLGHTYYDFPGTNTFSREWYAKFAFPKVFLSPVFSYYYDYGDEAKGGGNGQYCSLAASYTTALLENPALSLTLGASVGFNHELFCKGDGGDYLFTAGISVPLTKTCTLTPKIGYAIPFSDLKSSTDGNQKSRFYSGISLAYSF